METRTQTILQVHREGETRQVRVCSLGGKGGGVGGWGVGPAGGCAEAHGLPLGGPVWITVCATAASAAPPPAGGWGSAILKKEATVTKAAGPGGGAASNGEPRLRRR
jgi:hypothetical protein